MRSPFSAPSASVISASSISCITARTTSRRPSGCAAKVFDDGESGSRLECGCLVEH